MTEKTKFPTGWDEERVKRVIEHYESQSEEEAVAEDEGCFDPAAAIDEAELTSEELEELERRVSEWEANPNDGSSWPEVKERILKKS